MSTIILEHIKFSDLPKKIQEQIPDQGDKNGSFLLHLVLEDDEHAYFWTREWQQGEWEAEEDKKAGRISGPFDSVSSLKEHLLH